MSENYLLAVTRQASGQKDSNLVIISNYKTLDEAKQVMERSVNNLLNNAGTNDKFVVYKLSDENLVGVFGKPELKHAFQKVANDLNIQAAELLKQAEAAAAAANEDEYD